MRYNPLLDRINCSSFYGHMAQSPQEIVQKAEDCEIPTIENAPLAHALYDTAELYQEIPPALYGPVAEVLVYVFKLANKLPG